MALTALGASLGVTVRFDVLGEAEAVERFGRLAGALGQSAHQMKRVLRDRQRNPRRLISR